jgi:hypothetical protein
MLGCASVPTRIDPQTDMETRAVANEAEARRGKNLVQQIGNHETMDLDLKTSSNGPHPVALFRSPISMFC